MKKVKKMKNRQKLKEWGLEDNVILYRTRYPDVREGPGGYTVCLLFNRSFGTGIKDGQEPRCSRGIGFCSQKEEFRKKKGNDVSLGRAIGAWEHRLPSERIPKKGPHALLRINHGWEYFMIYQPTLTDYEIKLMEYWRQRRFKMGKAGVANANSNL